MTVQPDLVAVAALRSYLLRTLPAKVDALNLQRAASLTVPRAGPYVIPASASLKLGTTVGTHTTVALTAGSRTAAQLAAEISVAGVTDAADSLGRLAFTSTTAPSAGVNSVLTIGPDDTGTNSALGLNPGGQDVVRAPLTAPLEQQVVDGQPPVIDFGPGFGFWVILGDRTSEPRSANVRDDVHRVNVRAEVLCTEPNGQDAEAQELIGQCARAVRECLFEDRTLDSLVMLTEVSRVEVASQAFRFRLSTGYSPLISSAKLAIRCLVHERQ